MLTLLLALTIITTAKLASNIIARFIGNVLDYAGDTREDFMREYAEADAAFVARELRPARKMAEGGMSEQGGRVGTGLVAHHDGQDL